MRFRASEALRGAQQTSQSPVSPSCRAELGSAATSVQLQYVYVDPGASLHYVDLETVQ